MPNLSDRGKYWGKAPVTSRTETQNLTFLSLAFWREFKGSKALEEMMCTATVWTKNCPQRLGLQPGALRRWWNH